MRRKIRVGDRITFSKLSDLQDSLSVRVDVLTVFSTFAELVAAFPQQAFGYADKPRSEIVQTYRELYDAEEEQVCGVLAICITLLE